MANSKISATEGTGKNIASFSFTEDATTKELQRVVMSDSTGSVLSGLPVSQSGVWAASVAGMVNVGSVIGAITPYAQSGSFVWGVSSINTGTTATSVLAAPGASLRNYITTIKVTNAAASAAIVDIKDSGGDVLDSGYCAASGGGWSTTFTVPIRQTTTNKSVDVVPRSQASIIAAIVGYVAA